MSAARFFVLPALLLTLECPLAFAADTPATPGPGFEGSRYADLWTKSPFAIATPDGPAASTEYQLVGIAQFDGVSYASLIEKQSQEHFVLTSDKPVKNLTLLSITPGKGGSETSAVIQRNGESLTLKLEDAPPAATPGNMPVPPMNAPMPPPNGSSVGGIMYPNPTGLPPRVRIHRPLIHFPPPPVVPPISVPPPPQSH